ncbi:MAG TPA: HEAT repeat domain-containing protein, partial [Phycisphaerae bacterium]|nr:HEAT repeat domain-containing protein [Phycisphaerae bacterium]
MAKRMTTDDQLATLRRLRAGESSPAAIAELGTLLHTPKLHGLTLKGAADLAEKWDARPLAAALAQAAESLAPGMVEDPNKRDPGAEGKQAALRALVAWEAELPDLFLKAAAWKQHAPVMNGSVDVAAECRGLAAIGIAQTRAGGPEEAVSRMVDLLADQEHPTRARAAQALGMWRGPEAVPVLRLKALTGDEQPEVLGEVFASLIRHDPRSHLPFVTRFLDHEEEPIVEAAALALGESRQAAALPALAAAWQRLARRPV